jgi:hypothetical protein
MVKKINLMCCLLLFILFSCSTFNRCKVSEIKKNSHPNLPKVNEKTSEVINQTKKVVVYKSKKDFSTFVPIHLSEDKKNIIGYPAKEDLKQLGNSNAVVLENGYYLDLVGVNLNSVFTSYTLEVYKKINNPSLEDFKNHIIHLNPFEEMYICSDKHTNTELEQYIKAGALIKYCSKIK